MILTESLKACNTFIHMRFLVHESGYVDEADESPPVQWPKASKGAGTYTTDFACSFLHHCVRRFNPTASTWESLSPMTYCRRDTAVAVIGGKMYVCGGCDGANILNILGSAERCAAKLVFCELCLAIGWTLGHVQWNQLPMALSP